MEKRYPGRRRVPRSTLSRDLFRWTEDHIWRRGHIFQPGPPYSAQSADRCSRKSHYSPSEVIAREALLKKLRPWSALSLVRVKRSHGALIRRLVRTGSSPASRYSVVKRRILLSLHLYSFSGRSGAYFYAFSEKFLRYFFIFFPITAIPRETVV